MDLGQGQHGVPGGKVGIIHANTVIMLYSLRRICVALKFDAHYIQHFRIWLLLFFKRCLIWQDESTVKSYSFYIWLIV